MPDLTSGKGLVGSTGPAVPVKILWGSQTGNSEGLAKKMAKALTKANCAPEVVDMGSYDKAQLTEEQNILIITSTYGDGEPPDNAADLYEWILSEEAPKLETLNYSVLSLGDTEYPDFCKCGIDFDERLAALGAQRIFDRVDCDVDYDEPYAKWKDGVIAAIGTSATTSGSLDEDDAEDGYSKSNPYPSDILNNYNLNSADSARETYHIELSLKDSDLSYQTGDALGVYPVNPEVIVDEILKGLPFNTKEEIDAPSKLNGGGEISLREALLYYYDIRSISRGLIEEWQKRSGSPFLRSLVEAGSKEDFDNFIWGREQIAQKAFSQKSLFMRIRHSAFLKTQIHQ